MILGITGGVGSGKSAVLKILKKEYQADIIELDAIGKEVVLPGTIGYVKVKEAFSEALKKDGSLDREKLAEIIFLDPEKKAAMNALIHPLVYDEMIRRIQSSKSSLIVVESAILLTCGYPKFWDKLWFIYCARKIREKRLKETRNYSLEKIKSIMAQQPSVEFFKNHADYLIDNSGSLSGTREQIDKILKIML